MKKRLFSTLLALCLALSLLPTAVFAGTCEDGDNCDHVAAIGSEHYGTLEAAVADVATDGKQVVIDLLKDTTGAGIVVKEGQNIKFDLHWHTYTVESGVGSKDTETNGFQLLKGSTVVFYEGEIAVAKNAGIKILIQNYCDLTATNVTFHGENMANGNPSYVLSNNNGVVKFERCTVIAPEHDGAVAVDAAMWGSYAGADVTLEDCKVDGLLDTAKYEYKNGGWKRTADLAEVDGKPTIHVKSSGFYTDLYHAILAAEGKCYFKYDAYDLTITEPIRIKEGQEIVLEMGSLQSITANGCAVFDNAGELTVRGGATFSATGDSKQKAAVVNNSGTLLLEGGIFEQSGWYVINNSGKMTVDGDVTIQKAAGATDTSSIINNCGTKNKWAELTVERGSFIGASGENSCAVVKNDDYARLTINGGTFDSTANTAENNATTILNWGEATITDGTFTGKYPISNGKWEKDASGTMTIRGGTFTGTDTLFGVGTNNGKDVPTNKDGKLTITGGYFTAPALTKSYESELTWYPISITGGYFTADPTEYVDEELGYSVRKSDKSGYTYMVKDGDLNSTLNGLDISAADTDNDVNIDGSVDLEGFLESVNNDTNVNTVANTITENTSVTGTAAALKEKEFVRSHVARDQIAEATTLVVDVKVEVELTEAKVEDNGTATLTFKATPVADISVVDEDENKTAIVENKVVPNSMLKGKITVQLPLPEGFTPDQIKHVSSETNKVEYFLNKDSVGSKRGAKTFEVKTIEGVRYAVFQITHFSEFILSNVVDYKEPAASSSSSVSKPAHDVSVKKVAGGSVTVNQDEARQGTIVTVTAAPNSGYALDSLTVLDEDGNELKLNSLGGNKYSFIMPDGEVTVRASFTDGGDTGFVDVPADKYFAEPVAWAVASGITGGTDDTHFSPYASCTRGQLVTFLWRAAGKPAAEGAKGFSDVKTTSAFYQAILWASENGIVGGYADGSFRPNAAVTRQQVAAILYRYAQYAKMDVSVGEDTNILSFNDAFSVSEYAIAAFQWAVGEGVITGNGGNLLPHDTCTRAQIVTMLYRLLAD